MTAQPQPGHYDPLGYDLPLPLETRYYPMGYPLDLATNSPEVQAAARQIWGRFPARPGNHAAAKFRIIVDERNAAVGARPSMPRGQNHLVSIVHGPDNFAVCDLAAGFTFACLTSDVARDRAYLRYHFLDTAAYLMIDAAYLSPLHASCVALHGRAVLLCGDSGAGKTSLAYACARRGWTYLSDDATHIVRGSRDRAVIGRPFRIRFRESARKIFPELNAFPPELRPNGKLDIEADTCALGLTVAVQSNASHMVFLKRKNESVHATVSPYPRAAASGRLSNLVSYGDETVRAAQNRTLTEFLGLPIVEMTYGDFDGAETALRALVEQEG